jgi:sugar/nucleoside kinase (ribokinase family)
MTEKIYDVLVIGPISKDENIDFEGQKVFGIGGAVVYSAFAAAAGGNIVGVLTKTSNEDKELCSVFNVPKEDIYFAPSKATTSIRNQYLTADRERRICTAISVCDPFKLEEFPDVKARVFHFGGLIAGDFPAELIVEMSKRGDIAVDVQGYLRHAVNGKMEFYDWKEKKDYLKYITYFKTDAAEAQVLTGIEDRYEAARLMHSWGAKEVMISHNTEILVYDGSRFYAYPVKSRNLSGRTGRGDTVFASYITERLKKTPDEALLFAAAAVSLKMEIPGPFKGNRDDIERYISEFYR